MAHIRPISGKPHVGDRLRAETGPTITASLGHCRIPTAGRHGIPVVDRKWADLLCCVGYTYTLLDHGSMATNRTTRLNTE